MLEPRAQQPALPPVPRELPRPPAVSDNRLVAALTQRLGQDLLPFGAQLPGVAQLVQQAIFEDPPTVLHKQFQRQIGQALGALALAAGRLAAAAGALSPLNAFNAFRQVGVSVSDPTVVGGLALAGAQTADYSLIVREVAAAQENVGGLLARDGQVTLEPGRYQAKVRTRRGLTSVDVDIEPDASNETALSALAAAINDQRLGVMATLARPTANLIQVVISAEQAGAAGRFSLEESPLTAWAGADQVVREPKDAVYVLNGIATTSPESEVRLQGGKVLLALRRAQPSLTQTVRVGPDREAVLAAVGQLVDATNVMTATVTNNAASFAPAFVADFTAVVRSLRGPLAQIGIQILENNSLEVDRALLAATFERDPNSLGEAIASPNGAAQRLGAFATDVISAPISRVGAPEFVPPIPPATSHPNPAMIMASNTLSALLYSGLFAQGLFINTLF